MEEAITKNCRNLQKLYLDKITNMVKMSTDDLQAADLEFRITKKSFYVKFQNLEK